MASQQSTVDFIVEQISVPGSVSVKKMFGEYGLFCDDKMFALVCDDQLFVKKTAGGKEWMGECPEQAPYPGAKPWFFVSGEKWDDSEWLSHLMAVTCAQLPMSGKKPKKKPA